MFVMSSIDVEDEKDKMWLMGCVVKEEWCGWMLRDFEWHLRGRCHQAPAVSNRHHQ